MTRKKRGDTFDGTYWTVRRYNGAYWVVMIDNSAGDYQWVDSWGGYQYAGAAASAAAQLAYAQGVEDERARLRESLHEALDDAGLGQLKPEAPQIAASQLPTDADLEVPDQD